MAWTEDIYPHFESYDPNVFQILHAPQRPTAILQQLPATMMPPGLTPSIRTGGHVKEDLVQLMMIQNAQMHQVIMNNMTVSALRSFRYADPPPGPEAPRDLVVIQDNEPDPEIYHHYYQSDPYLSCPSWLLPQASLVHQEDPNKPTSAPPHRDRPAAPPPPPPPSPPPPPPSASATVGVNVAPVAENHGAAETGAEKKRE